MINREGQTCGLEQRLRTEIEAIPAYVPGKPIEELERELGITTAIKMASNENPLGPAPEVRQAIEKTIAQIAYYPDANGYHLREALSAELGVAPTQLLMGNGSDDVNKILGETLLNPDDEVIISQPTFSQYEFVALLMGAKPVMVKGRELGQDLEAMKAAITTRTKLIFICNPNNPTGTYVSGEQLRQFVAAVPREIAVVIDEAYADFAVAPDFVSGLTLVKEGYDNVVIYRTFSKIYGLAGLRLGFAVAAPGLVAKMDRVREPFNVNLLAQTAGIAALKARDHLQASRELVAAGRSLFYSRLEAMGLAYLPTQANFILIHCGRDSRPVYHYLLHQGIIVRATHSFGLSEHLRVTFGTNEQNQAFFKHFKDAMESV